MLYKSNEHSGDFNATNVNVQTVFASDREQQQPPQTRKIKNNNNSIAENHKNVRDILLMRRDFQKF